MSKRVLDTMSVQAFIDQKIAEIKAQVVDNRVLLGLSGGVDSSVCAALLARALPDRTICIFVDTGLMRLNEANLVKKAFEGHALKLIRVDAEQRFLDRLKGVVDPNKKRMVIGQEFVRVFEEEAEKLGDIGYLGQGSILPDFTESRGKNPVKPHHNVGGLPEDMQFVGLVEPIRDLYKDEVRQVGKALGLPQELFERQPFPGPGLGVRCIGELTKPKLDLLRQVDAIFREEVDKLTVRPSQYFAVHTGLNSTGLSYDENMEGSRIYGAVFVLRAIVTEDYVTATSFDLPKQTVDSAVKRITALEGVSRVLLDITEKPPATVEWE